MSIYLCTYIIMTIIKDIEDYVNLCCAPHMRIPDKKTIVFDNFIDVFESLYKTVWFRNIFIEYLIEQWIIKQPFMIYSPRKWTPTEEMICEWVYKNHNWHIYYDPMLITQTQMIEFNKKKYELKIRLHDSIAILYLWEITNEVIWKIKTTLFHTLVQWNFSENE